MRSLLEVSLYSLIASLPNPPGDDGAEARAVAFLSREVPRWSAENQCFSCHNNGDAARALFMAKQLSHRVTQESLTDTIDWLTNPDRWDRNGGDGPANDKRLARVQFAAALNAAMQAGLVPDRVALRRAAERVAADQEADGSWLSDAGTNVGSPATYGRALGTFLARETLRAADAVQYAENIARADKWLRRLEIHNIVDAAAVLLASTNERHSAWGPPRNRALDLLSKGQSPDGGWGPFVGAAPEPFDTALVVLAISSPGHPAQLDWMIERGREFLIAQQLPDGSWPETTRPAGSESYAQRLSTTAWATLALLRTVRKDAGSLAK